MYSLSHLLIFNKQKQLIPRVSTWLWSSQEHGVSSAFSLRGISALDHSEDNLLPVWESACWRTLFETQITAPPLSLVIPQGKKFGSWHLIIVCGKNFRFLPAFMRGLTYRNKLLETEMSFAIFFGRLVPGIRRQKCFSSSWAKYCQVGEYDEAYLVWPKLGKFLVRCQVTTWPAATLFSAPTREK